jgi:hypothetical protein
MYEVQLLELLCQDGEVKWRFHRKDYPTYSDLGYGIHSRLSFAVVQGPQNLVPKSLYKLIKHSDYVRLIKLLIHQRNWSAIIVSSHDTEDG